MINFRLLIFLVVSLTIVIGGHIYLYRRMVRDTTSNRRLRWLGLATFILLGFLALALRLLFRRASGPVTAGMGVALWTWMGLGSYLILSVFMADLWRWGRGLFARLRGQRREVSEERRLFLSRAVAGGAAMVSTTLTGYGTYRAFTEPVVSEVVVPLPGLPQQLDGFGIVQISDVHVGAVIERRFMDELVRRCNALSPDVMAITGDLVDGSVARLGHAVSALQNLKTKYGSYFVTGNHEYYSGDVAWASALDKMGIHVLRNRFVTIGDSGASFDLVGVDDWSAAKQGFGQGYDLEKATRGRDATRPGVLLAHQPRDFDAAREKGLNLQLSGHTHGGQFFPWTLVTPLVWEWNAGLYSKGAGHIYVSRGAGFWGPPIRVASPPEIVKVVLKAA